jgi:hypothetical protein
MDQDLVEIEEGEEHRKPTEDGTSDQLTLTATATCRWFG